MKKTLFGLLLALTAFSMVAESNARPLGGGKTIGRQSQNVQRTAPVPAPAAAPAQRPAAAPAAAPVPPAPVPKPPSPWKGILGGALLGLGLGALFSHFGMGAGMAGALGSILTIGLILLAIYFVVSLFRRKSPVAPAQFGGFGSPVAQPAGFTPVMEPRVEPSTFQPVASPAAKSAPWGVPADFDTAGFLRQAKSNFIRMQAAWDKADVNDLREFTTPEVFAELRLQIQERGASADFTDVVTIEADMLGIETIGNDYLASVKFNGQIRSAPNAPAEPFSEVWNLSKPVSGPGIWLLAGIQQLS